MNNTTTKMASLHISSPVPTPEPSPEPTPEHSPEPTPEHSPEPSPEPTPEHSPEPSPEPTPEHSPEPSPDATPEPQRQQSKKRKRGSAGIALQFKKIKLLEYFMEVSSLIISIINTLSYPF